jgi:hypothetical protein
MLSKEHQARSTVSFEISIVNLSLSYREILQAVKFLCDFIESVFDGLKTLDV